jgi:uroporphyrinogen-III synthase
MSHVLLLTSPGQASDLSFLLEDEGLEPLYFPVLAGPRALPKGLLAIADRVARLQWVIVIGVGSLRAFLEALHIAGTRPALKGVGFLASDALTARAIERQGAQVRVAGDGKWTSVVAGHLGAGDEVAVIHEVGGLPQILPEALDAAQVHFSLVEVEKVEAPSPPRLSPNDLVIVHSIAAAEAWADLTKGPRPEVTAASCCAPSKTLPASARCEDLEAKVLATSALAAAALDARGIEVCCVALSPSADAVVDAALRALDAASS